MLRTLTKLLHTGLEENLYSSLPIGVIKQVAPELYLFRAVGQAPKFRFCLKLHLVSI